MGSERTFEEVAKELAIAHRASDPDTEEVLLAPDPEAKEIWLIEVLEGMPTTGEVFEHRYAPSEAEGVPFPAVLVFLSRDEWRQCLEGKLKLPPAWGDPGTFKRLA